jgi:hypothetical protein
MVVCFSGSQKGPPVGFWSDKDINSREDSKKKEREDKIKKTSRKSGDMRNRKPDRPDRQVSPERDQGGHLSFRIENCRGQVLSPFSILPEKKRFS